MVALAPPEAFKFANWQTFFEDIHVLCVQHVPDSPGFFGTLTQDLLDRLVKAVPVGRPINSDTLSYLKAFSEMAAKNHAKSGQGTDHEETMYALAGCLNFGCAPGQSFFFVALESLEIRFGARSVMCACCFCIIHMVLSPQSIQRFVHSHTFV